MSHFPPIRRIMSKLLWLPFRWEKIAVGALPAAFRQTSGRKQKAWNKPFAGLGYECMLSWCVAHTEEQKNANQAEFAEEKSIFFWKDCRGEFDFMYWWQSILTEPLKPGQKSSAEFQKIQDSTKDLQLLEHENDIKGFQKFMGTTLEEPTLSCCETTRKNRTTLILTFLDAYVATAVLCLREDCSDSVSGHRQQLYNNFFFFLSIS